MNTKQEALEDFSTFWQRHFPEMHTMSRETALLQIDDCRWLQSHQPDAEMRVYQNRVVAVYGAYEQAIYQQNTLSRILTNISAFPARGQLVSLGSGPGSYELWLLTVTQLSRVTLVDHSRKMLERAEKIAQRVGQRERTVTRLADATQSGIVDAAADIVFSINAMHWSENWRIWIEEACRIAKAGAEVFLSCTLDHPRTGITMEDFVDETSRHFAIHSGGFILEPQVLPGGLAVISNRAFACGRKA